MKKGVKKALKITSITIGALIVIAATAIAVVLNFIFTPEKITPAINKVAAEYIDADVKIGSVELTFFSTFPRFSVILDDMHISPEWAPKPFVELKKAEVSLNPIKYLTEEKIRIGQIRLEEPNIYLYVDSTGRSVISVFKLDSTENDTSSLKLDLGVRLFSIDNGRIAVDDRSNGFYASTDSIDVKLAGLLSEKMSAIKAKMAFKDMLAWQSGEVLFKKLSLDINSQVRYNPDSLRLNIDTARFDMGGLVFGAAGTLRGDSVNKRIEVNVGVGMKIRSFADVMTYIPPTILRKDVGMKSDGEAVTVIKLNGYYGKDIMPEIKARLTLDGGSFHYDKMPVGVDNLDIDAEAFVNPMDKKQSFLRVNKFNMKSGPATIDLKGGAANILGDPIVRFSLNSNVNLTELARIFPLADGLTLKGHNTTAIKGRFRMSALKDRDYGSMWLDGSSRFSDMTLILRGGAADSSYLYASIKRGDFNFGNSVKKDKLVADTSNLTADIILNGMGFRNDRGARINMAGIELKADSKRSSDTTTLSTVYTQLNIDSMSILMPDTLDGVLRKCFASLKIEPFAPHSRRALITGIVNADSLSATSKLTNAYASMNKGGFKLTATAPERKGGRWYLRGALGFGGLKGYSDIFPLPISMPVSSVSVDGSRITLNRTRMRVGDSDLTITGYFDNLLRTMFGSKKARLNGEISLRSRNINANELLAALDAAALYEDSATTDSLGTTTTTANTGDTLSAKDIAESGQPKAASAEADTTLTIFMIPRTITMNVNMNVDTVRIGSLLFSGINGNLSMNRGAMRLKGFNMNGLGAAMKADIYYRATNRRGAFIKTWLRINDIDISRIGELMPSIVEATPMIKDLRGDVNMSMAMTGNLAKDMTIKMPSLKGVISLDGQNLVLMDGKTFAEISKMLMFKNKERNLIDSLGLNIVAQNGRMDVPPFELEIDRYRAIIGGTQTVSNNFDIDFKYNISIIKSPLPIKAGVDIFGNLDDFDFKITKAKLKKADFADINKNVDSIRNVMITEVNRDNAVRDVSANGNGGKKTPKKKSGEAEQNK